LLARRYEKHSRRRGAACDHQQSQQENPNDEGFHATVLNWMAAFYQKLQAPFHATQIPRRKLVMPWASIASPKRFFRTTNHWYESPHRMPASHRSACINPKMEEVTTNESAWKRFKGMDL